MKYLNVCNKLIGIKKLLKPHKCQEIIHNRYFHQTSSKSARNFIDNENTHAFKIIENTSKLKIRPLKIKTEIISLTNVETLSLNELVTKFVECSQSMKHTPLSDPQFDRLIEGILRQCRELSDDQIQQILLSLQQFPETESINSHNFGDLWSALDDMCIERYKNWDYDQILTYGHLWYKLRLGKVSEFMQLGMDRIIRKPAKLNANQLVQTLFYMNVIRKPFENMFEIEHQIGVLIDEFSMDELAVISMAFFKTQSKIHNSRILSQIIDLILANLSIIHEITLCSFMKILRYSRHLDIIDKMRYLLDQLVNEIDRLSLLSCIHIALLGTNAQLFHLQSINKISNKLINNIQTARLKDIERLTFVTTLYNFTPQADFYTKIIEELKNRNIEIQKHPRCFNSCLHYLSLLNFYPMDLIEQAMHPDFIKHTYGKNLIGRELFHLDLSAGVDLDRKSCLPEKSKMLLSKMYTRYPPKRGKRLNVTDKFMMEVMEGVLDLFGNEKFYQVLHVLPQYERAGKYKPYKHM